MQCLAHHPRQSLCRYLLQHKVNAATFATTACQAQLQAVLRQRRPHRQPVYSHGVVQSGQTADIWVVGWFDENFPDLLRHIADPPLLLYGRGDIRCLHAPALAIVGARRCTPQGRHLAEDLADQLAGLGLVVVSGLAYGIDGAAHSGALKAAGGRTIAVLGGGLNRLYPASHGPMAQAIVDQAGAVISEYPPEASPRRHHFVERNRLVSGLSQGVVVVEAGVRSGSLTTAGFAAEQGREVMVVPGPVGSAVSQGCHRLIQQGAALVTGAQDVMALLGIQPPAPLHSGTAQQQHGSELATAILQALAGYPRTVDELVVQLQVSHQQMLVALSELEVAGFVEQGAVGYIATS